MNELFHIFSLSLKSNVNFALRALNTFQVASGYCIEEGGSTVYITV